MPGASLTATARGGSPRPVSAGRPGLSERQEQAAIPARCNLAAPVLMEAAG